MTIARKKNHSRPPNVTLVSAKLRRCRPTCSLLQRSQRACKHALERVKPNSHSSKTNKSSWTSRMPCLASSIHATKRSRIVRLGYQCATWRSCPSSRCRLRRQSPTKISVHLSPLSKAATAAMAIKIRLPPNASLALPKTKRRSKASSRKKSLRCLKMRCLMTK